MAALVTFLGGEPLVDESRRATPSVLQKLNMLAEGLRASGSYATEDYVNAQIAAIPSGGGMSSPITGTWTPTAMLSTPGTSVITYTTQTGTYTRSGDLVTLFFRLVFTITKGTGTGQFQIGGVPINVAELTTPTGTIRALNSSWTWPAGITALSIAPATATLLIVTGIGSAVNVANFNVANLTDGASHTIVGSITYKA